MSKWRATTKKKREDGDKSWSWSAWLSDSWYCQLGDNPPHLPPLCQGKLITSMSDLELAPATALANVTPLPSLRKQYKRPVVLAEQSVSYRAHSDTALEREFSFMVWHLIELNLCSQPFVRHNSWLTTWKQRVEEIFLLWNTKMDVCVKQVTVCLPPSLCLSMWDEMPR